MPTRCCRVMKENRFLDPKPKVFRVFIVYYIPEFDAACADLKNGVSYIYLNEYGRPTSLVLEMFTFNKMPQLDAELDFEDEDTLKKKRKTKTIHTNLDELPYQLVSSTIFLQHLYQSYSGIVQDIHQVANGQKELRVQSKPSALNQRKSRNKDIILDEREPAPVPDVDMFPQPNITVDKPQPAPLPDVDMLPQPNVTVDKQQPAPLPDVSKLPQPNVTVDKQQPAPVPDVDMLPQPNVSVDKSQPAPLPDVYMLPQPNVTVDKSQPAPLPDVGKLPQPNVSVGKQQPAPVPDVGKLPQPNVSVGKPQPAPLPDVGKLPQANGLPMDIEDRQESDDGKN